MNWPMSSWGHREESVKSRMPIRVMAVVTALLRVLQAIEQASFIWALRTRFNTFADRC